METYIHVRQENYETRPPHSATAILTGHARLIRWEFPNLAGPFWRWYANDAPGGFIIMKGRRYPLTPGRIFLIPPHTQFASGVTRPVWHTFLHFTLDLGHMTATDVIFSHLSTPLETKLRKSLVQALKRPGPNSSIQIGLITQTLIHLALNRVPSNYWQTGTPDSRIDRLIRKIHEQFPAALKNAELASSVGMNVNAFTRYFRQKTGRSPLQFLIGLRIEKACQLLRQKDLTLDEIAGQTGFFDQFHFSKAFKRHLHVSPAAFRREQNP